MNIDMYEKHFALQKKHWWFVGKSRIVMGLISEYCTIGRHSKILDIGCGAGLMLPALSELSITYGMDTSDEAIKFSRANFTGLIKKGSLPNDVPFFDNQFNLITALDVLEHIEDDLKSLYMIHNLLCFDGVAVLSVPAHQYLWTKFDDENEHKRRYSWSEFKCKLEEAGFTIKKLSFYNSILYFPSVIVIYLNKYLNTDIGRELKSGNPLFNWILTRIFSLEKTLLRFINFPFGLSLIAVVSKK